MEEAGCLPGRVMNLAKSNLAGRRALNFRRVPHSHAAFLLSLIWCWMAVANGRLAAAEPGSDSTPTTGGAIETNAAPRFDVADYQIGGNIPVATNDLAPLLSSHTGMNISLAELVKAAADLHEAYRRQGHPLMSVAIPLEMITNGIVTLNPFQTAVPQVVVSGQTYLTFTNAPDVVIPEIAANPVTGPVVPPEPPPVTNAVAPVHVPTPEPATPAQIEKARAVLLARMNDINEHGVDNRIHVVSTNSGPRFAVGKYLVMGNTALPPAALSEVLTNIDGAYGTNVSFAGIRTAVEELQRAYRERGYVTVVVGLPQQKLTNATVKVQVVEGRLAVINVTGNEYFSSNNVMRALPGLHTNLLLNGPVFQAELNRANASRDRQIYPLIGPGPEPGTSALTLKVKDQLPLHGKVDFNNESSPGTPDLRVNTSAVYDNLWQREHSLGVQYSFSPQQYKSGDQWNFYDLPLVANYSAFYRLPLGNPQSIEEAIAGNPDNFGYSEATRKFTLPPSSGQSELTIYGSRSTIDTGLETLSSSIIYDVPGVRQISRQDVQQDLTVNDDVGFRLSKPLPPFNDIRTSLSGGMDYKYYSLTDNKTNIFNFTEITRKPDGSLNPPIVSTVSSPVPTTVKNLNYLPLALNYDATTRGLLGLATLSLGVSGNAWYSGSQANLQNITGSTESKGHWVTLTPSLTWIFNTYTNWPMTIHANGQWASEPLISNEQFGAGGVNSVRGYHEGEVFGDTGWHLSAEQQTPSHLVGMVNGNLPLTVRGSVYMDYSQVFSIDPLGPPQYQNLPDGGGTIVTYPSKRPESTRLWGTGFGFTASVGSHWDARFLFSFPLLSAGTVQSGQPFFNFGLTAQF